MFMFGTKYLKTPLKIVISKTSLPTPPTSNQNFKPIGKLLSFFKLLGL